MRTKISTNIFLNSVQIMNEKGYPKWITFLAASNVVRLSLFSLILNFRCHQINTPPCLWLLRTEQSRHN